MPAALDCALRRVPDDVFSDEEVAENARVADGRFGIASKLNRVLTSLNNVSQEVGVVQGVNYGQSTAWHSARYK